MKHTLTELGRLRVMRREEDRKLAEFLAADSARHRGVLSRLARQIAMGRVQAWAQGPGRRLAELERREKEGRA